MIGYQEVTISKSGFLPCPSMTLKYIRARTKIFWLIQIICFLTHFQKMLVRHKMFGSSQNNFGVIEGQGILL